MSGFAEQGVALRHLAELLDDTARRLTGLPAAIAAAWDEPAGREWSDRLELVRRETLRRADDAADRAAADPAPTARDPAVDRDPVYGAGSGPSGTGLRLGGPTGSRSTDRRGVVAPLLPPFAPVDPGRTG
ncbi:hypothetical protein ACLFMI_08695 [Pseudonocardia nantongensis]|uniref:hypothetical protein n=1 Tax=Pseudonocardia nantongensis TaxID=1181885 RepID=UPI00397835A4